MPVNAGVKLVTPVSVVMVSKVSGCMPCTLCRHPRAAVAPPPPAPEGEGAAAEGGEEGEAPPPAKEASTAGQELPVTQRSGHAAVAIDKDLYVMMGDHDGDFLV
jgi:hypothetical protein